MSKGTSTSKDETIELNLTGLELNGRRKSKQIELTSHEKTAEEILKLSVDSIPMLLTPMLQKKGLGTLSGSSDAGKSFFCLQLSLAISMGDKAFLDMDLYPKHKSVIFVCTEEYEEEICCKITPMCNGKTFNKKNLRFIFETTDIVGKLKKSLKRQPADLVIIDTFGDIFRGNLNNSIDVRTFFEDFKALAKEFDCLILFTHHIGKSKDNNAQVSKNDVLGSQAIESACRMVLMLKKMEDSTRILKVVKGNNIPDEVKKKGISLTFSKESGFTPSNQKNILQIQTDDLEKKVLDLYPKMKSLRKVADLMKSQGYTIDKNKVSEILKKRPSVPNNGETSERTSNNNS